MSDRQTMREVFVGGLKDYDSRINEVFHQDEDTDSVDRPYVYFTPLSIQKAPWERENRDEQSRQVVTDSNGNDFVETDYGTVSLLRISFTVAGDVDTSNSEVAQKVESYFRKRWRREALDQGLYLPVYEVETNGRTATDLPGVGTVRPEWGVEAVFQVADEYLEEIETVEQVTVKITGDVSGTVTVNKP